MASTTDFGSVCRGSSPLGTTSLFVMKKEDLLLVILSVVVFVMVYMILTLNDRIEVKETEPIPVLEKVDYDTIRDVRFLT